MRDDMIEDYIKNMTEEEIAEIESKLQKIMNKAEDTIVAFEKEGEYSFEDALFYASCILALVSVETGFKLDDEMGGGAKSNADTVCKYIVQTADDLMIHLIERVESNDE